MPFDFLNLQPTVISRDLSGKYMLIYSKPKVGKTSFAAQMPRNIILATEIGTNALDGQFVAKIQKWTDMKDALRELRKPGVREKFDTVTIDTISIAADLAEKFICQRESVETIREVPYGQGWKMVAKELQETLREITMLGYGLLLICHSKDHASNITDEDGNPITSVEPDLSKNVYTVCNAICDLIAYIGVEFDKNGESHRYLYTRQTPTVFAGSRWGEKLAPKIEFGYQTLVDAIGDAIDIAAKNGATVVDKIDNVVVERTFGEVMAEAKEIWNSYISDPSLSDEEYLQRENVIKELLRKVFGNEDFKLSTATPGQKDLVEYFVNELRDII